MDDPTKIHHDEPDSPTIGQYNLSIWNEYVTAFRAAGMLAGGWATEGGSIYKVPSGSDLAIAEIEGPGDYDGVINVLHGVGGGPWPMCPVGIVTNFSTITPDRAKPLIQAGIACLPEAYMSENPNQTPDNMDRLARSLGWPTSQPVAGTYPNPVTGVWADYSQWDYEWPLADYTAEYII